MAYCFDRDASVQKDLRRIAAAQITGAIDSIDDHGLDSDVVVHEVRKTAKKLRGLIRLLRPHFDSYKAENAALRDMAGLLAPLRDAAVLIKTYDALIASADADIPRADCAAIRRRLTIRQKMLDRDASSADRKLGDARDLLLKARARIDEWKLGESGFDAIEGGLTKTYKRARKSMKEAERAPDSEALHEWRKLVKYHSYHARLLEPVWPAAMQAHRQATDELNDLLGEHHDLAVFAETLRDKEFSELAARIALDALITRRQAALASEAFAIGARLFAEPADQLAQRWRSYWTLWRNGAAAANAA